MGNETTMEVLEESSAAIAEDIPEGGATVSDGTQDDLLGTETVPPVEEPTSEDVFETEAVPDPPPVEPTEDSTEESTGDATEESTGDATEESTEDTTEESSTGMGEGEEYGKENNSVSGNAVAGGDGGTGGSLPLITYAEVGDSSVNVWEADIMQLSSTDMILLMLLLVALAQFVHNLFKGSHWFKGL